MRFPAGILLLPLGAALATACVDEYSALTTDSGAPEPGTDASAPALPPDLDAGADAAITPDASMPSWDIPIVEALEPVGMLSTSDRVIDVVGGDGDMALIAYSHSLLKCSLPTCEDARKVYENEGFTFRAPLSANPSLEAYSIPAQQDSSGSNEFLALTVGGSLAFKVRNGDVLSACVGGSFLRMGIRDAAQGQVSVRSLKKPVALADGIDDPMTVRTFARSDLGVAVPIACADSAFFYANPDDHILYSSRFSNVTNTQESRTPLTPAAPEPISALDLQGTGTFAYSAGAAVYACGIADAGICTPTLLRTLPAQYLAKKVTAHRAWIVETDTESFVEHCSTATGDCAPVRFANAFAKTAILFRGGNLDYVVDVPRRTTVPDGAAPANYPIYRLPAVD